MIAMHQTGGEMFDVKNSQWVSISMTPRQIFIEQYLRMSPFITMTKEV